MSTRTDLPGSVSADYARDDERRPLATYASLSAAFGVAPAGALAAAPATGRELPERLEQRS